MNKKNSCGLTPVVSKVSSGALEFIPLYTVKFVSHFFDDAKKDPLNFKIISTALSDMGDNGEVKHKADDYKDLEEHTDDEEEVIEFGDIDTEVKASKPMSSNTPLIPLDQLKLDHGKK